MVIEHHNRVEGTEIGVGMGSNTESYGLTGQSGYMQCNDVTSYSLTMPALQTSMCSGFKMQEVGTPA